MRIAWFSPLPPVRSGIAAYSDEILPRLRAAHAIDVFVDGNAHDFLWRRRLDPYDLVVYQLGNAPCHDYMWAYLAAFPGLVVLHDTRLHHARARRLLSLSRADDYRAEFQYDHPDAPRDAAEYSVNGLGGSMSYFWPMLSVVARTARTIAVHNDETARSLAAEYPDAPIEVIRMGVAEAPASAERDRTQRRMDLKVPGAGIVFAAFGKITAEKRVEPILRALAALVREDVDPYLLLVGDAAEYPSLSEDLARLQIGDRVRVTGYVPDQDMYSYLAAADACLCLRWPSAGETSASWLRCLAAGRATIVTELGQLATLPVLDPGTGRSRRRGTAPPVAISVDLLDEDRELQDAMRWLARDRDLRLELGRAAHAHWAANHTLDAMAQDYARVLHDAAARPVPASGDLPAHFTADYSSRTRAILRHFGASVDFISS
jgi:glycosyltransferase involved in cell wall biosynthesis